MAPEPAYDAEYVGSSGQHVMHADNTAAAAYSLVALSEFSIRDVCNLVDVVNNLTWKLHVLPHSCVT